jgi:hypothetical protein
MSTLEAIKARTAAATDGPWYADEFACVTTDKGVTAGYPAQPGPIASLDDGEYIKNKNAKTDAQFIAHAREDVPRLVAAIEAVEGEIKNLDADSQNRIRAAIRKALES